MASTRRRGPTKAQQDLEPPSNVLSQLELVELFHKKAVIELIVVEFAPVCYRLEAIVSWRAGRWALTGTRGPRTFRSLDTLARQLKALGAGRTVTRLELLT
jgi:hypothetical protein